MKNPMYFWTKERCEEVALLCKNKKELREKYEGAYKYAYKNKILDTICSHMTIQGNFNKRLIYAFIFTNNSIYIGLTCNSDRRKNEHLNLPDSTVNKYMQTTKLIPKYIELTDYINVDEAILKEEYYVNYYRKLGCFILNKNKTGGIGGSKIKWTYENCKLEAKKYENRHSFERGSGRAYRKSMKEGWISEFFPKIKDKKPNGYWSLDKCIEAISNCKTRKEFVKNYSGAFFSCRKNNWLEEVIKNLGKAIH